MTIALTAVAKTYLVCVGVSDYSGYPSKASSLRLPVNDARTIAEIQTINKTRSINNGSLVYALLLDSLATKDRIIRAMNKLYQNAKEDDTVILFFSGHGYNGGFCVYDGDIEYDDIRIAMSNSKSRNKMIFADACRSGGLREKRVSSDLLSEDSSKANVMLLLSSRTNENSIERSDMQNGFFTEFLKRGLSGKADFNRDRVITAKELFEYVHKGVIDISDGKQHPVMWGNFNDQMPVIKW